MEKMKGDLKGADGGVVRRLRGQDLRGQALDNTAMRLQLCVVVWEVLRYLHFERRLGERPPEAP